MRVLIVDDERLARDELRRLLRPYADVVIAAEAATADEAVARASDTDVDLMLLDIEMPGGNGFELLERLDRVPAVVFTTAYDEFAVRAFEVNALDYLMKPIHPDRLAAALDRVRTTLGARPDSELRHPLERVFVRDGERCWLIPVTSIALFESDGNYTRVYFEGNRPLVRTALQRLEGRLDPAVFFRASRTHVLNLRFIERIEPAVNDGLTVRVRTVGDVPVSRRQARRLRDAWSLDR
jgi:two-component system, LytTR family, response regulator